MVVRLMYRDKPRGKWRATSDVFIGKGPIATETQAIEAFNAKSRYPRFRLVEVTR